MKAVLTDERFSDPAWIYERKLDGIRCLATKARQAGAASAPATTSASTAASREVAAALEADPADRPRPRRRGRRLRRPPDQLLPPAAARRAPDAGLLLRVRHPARSTARTSPRCRCASARRCCATRSPSTTRSASRPTATATARRSTRRPAARAGRALIAKRADAPYTHGRSRDWLKFKCSAEQELVIGGYTAPARQPHRPRRAAARLLRRRRAPLRGQGRHRLHPRDAARPRRRLAPAAARRLAVRRRGPRARRRPGCEPELVAQVGFSEWTRDDRLRHPRFLGLRDDKAAREVVREAR